MRRRVIQILPFVVVAALLAPGATASAAPLDAERARALALKLGRQVAKEREALSWRVSEPVKVRSNRVVFAYGERVRGERACTARLTVEGSSTRMRASLSGSRCGPIPQEALALERAAIDAIGRVSERAPAVRNSVNEYELEAEECDFITVPRARQADVDSFVDLGLELAIYEPVIAELGEYVTALESVGARNGTLAAGVVAWGRFLRVLDAVPDVARDACPAVRRWAADGYDSASAPVDFAELRRTRAAFERQERALLRASERLEELVVSRRGAAAFFPYDLISLAAFDPRR